MASSPKLFTSFLLITLLFIQIHARDSKYFFSKVPNNNVDNFDTKETQIPNNNKLDPLTNPEKTTTTPQDQEPNFIPQTQDNSYGLYGHESGQLPPNSDNKFDDNNNSYRNDVVVPNYKSTTTTFDENNNYRNDVVRPNYKSESEEYYNYNNNNNENFENFENGNSKKPYENSFYYNKDLYDNGQQSFQNTRLSRDDYTTTPLYNQGKYDNFYNNDNNNENKVVRQGLSDTRFMENGKYYYDLNNEPHQYSRSRGQFGNNNNYYNGNDNTYQYGNSMGRYQNQNDDAEFQEEPDEFVP